MSISPNMPVPVTWPGWVALLLKEISTGDNRENIIVSTQLSLHVFTRLSTSVGRD